MAEKYRVGIIGRTGRGNYGHGLDTVWEAIPSTEVIAVADEDADGRAKAAKRTGAHHAYADYRQMLAKEKLDIVAVAPRWIDCHRDMVLAVAAAGCHIFLEKPMSRTLAEADEMIDACDRAGVKTLIAHQTRYNPVIAQVENLIREGKLGDILELRGRGKEDRRGGGEDLMVLGTHIMDLMCLFSGRPKWCFATVKERGKPVTAREVRDGNEGIGPLAGDEIHAMYGFDSPAIGTFSTHKAQHGASSRFALHILGSLGMLAIRTSAEVYFCADPSWNPARSKTDWVRVTSQGVGKPETRDDLRLHCGNVFAVTDLLHAIESGARTKGGLDEGRAALEMILAVYDSHRRRAPVPMPLTERRHPLELL